MIWELKSVIAVPFFGLEILTVFGLDDSPVTPKTSFPKLILSGDALGAVEAAMTPAADASKSISEKPSAAIGRVNDWLKRIDRLLPKRQFQNASDSIGTA